MFGFYRTFLALVVVFHHLLDIPVIGKYAVHGFFILSGYLMTHIMHQSYGYHLQGYRAFALNRFLRLFPTYWFVLLVSLIVIGLIGENFSRQFHAALTVPDTFRDWFQNLSMIFADLFPGQQKPRLSPPTWALTVELLYYLLIALGISRFKTFTWLWFAGGVMYMILTHWLAHPYAYRYETLFAGSLPFSMGALVYHYREQLSAITQAYNSHVLLIVASILLILNTVIGVTNTGAMFELSYYANFIINTIIIVVLLNVRPSGSLKRLDKKIGDYSYPIYLAHWQLAAFFSFYLYGDNLLLSSLEKFWVLLPTLLATLSLAYISIHGIDYPVEKLRLRIKQRLQT
jgi:peptidoglycan/LPS O-acetylase OafA/YrhL